MFKHIFIYRLKCLLRDRMTVFWTMLFPIALATFYALAFTNLSTGQAFCSIPVAVVQQAGENETLLSVMEDAQGEEGMPLFSITHTSEQEAQRMLEDGGIDGYLLLDNGVQVVVKESGYSQTILKEFVDSVLQAESAYGNIIEQDPQAAQHLTFPETRQYTKESSQLAKTDMIVTFFYALIAMAAMFGSFWGVREIIDIQPNMSGTGARVNLAPMNRLKALLYSVCASSVLHFASLLALVAYMVFALGIDFAGHVLQIVFVCFAGSMAGISLGALLGVLVRGNENAKILISLAISMLLSFFAGLMTNNIKVAVTNAVPLMGYINPANLISDAFYALYYYGSGPRFYMNIVFLLGLAAVFYVIVYFVIRRQRHASL